MKCDLKPKKHPKNSVLEYNLDTMDINEDNQSIGLKKSLSNALNIIGDSV